MTKILIESRGSKTPANLIEGQPDLSKFSEPELSLLQAAYNSGSYTIVPYPLPISIPLPPNWEGLTNSFRGTGIFSKAIQTKNTNGFTLLMNALTTLRNEADLEFGVMLVRQGLAEDFNPEEIIQINRLLEDCNFTLRIS